MKRVFAVLLVTMLVLTTGCGKRAEGTPKTESGPVEDKTEDESISEKELAAIEESKLAAPKKVAALSANTAAMWKLAGGKISVGVEEVSGVPKDNICGTEEEPDIDAALLLEPDLMLVDKKAGNYEDILSYLDMTEGAPPYITADIRSFDDYADCMLQMAKYTKDAEAYRMHVVDVRWKNAEVIARGRDALEVLIQTMPMPENELFDDSMAEKPDEAASSDADAAKGADASGISVDNGAVTDSDASMESGEESVPADTEKVASVREAVTVMLLRVDKDSCAIQGSYDYVSNMLADFGLVNVNPDTITVTVKLPKEKDAEKVPAKSAVVSETAESEVNDESGAAISGAEEAQESKEAAGGDSAVSGAEAAQGAEVAQGAEGTEGGEATVGTEENSDYGTEATTVTVTGTEANAEAEPESMAGVEVTVSSEDAADAEAYGSAAGAEGEEPAGAEADGSAAGTEGEEPAGTEADGSAAESDGAAAGVEADDSAAVTDGATSAVTKAGDEEAKAEAAFEKILKRNPDYIFVIYEGKEKEAEKTYKKICESKEFWSEMTAVKNRRVYTLPQSTFATPPNAQWDLAYEYLYQTMFVM